MGRNAQGHPPFGGLASFISFPGQIGFAQESQRRRPFAGPTSNNAIPLAQALTAFLLPVVIGAQRSAPTAGGCGPLLDSTVLGREGQQEGARKGFHPRRRGRNSPHPLVEATLDWLKGASPKWIPPEDRLAIGGGLI